MKQILTIPDKNHIKESLELAWEYGLGFEYNDFFVPDVLDDEEKLAELIAFYRQQKMPAYTTVHGAFYDVTPFSADAKIREIAMLRIGQSIEAAKRLGAKAVIFHTNYNPMLNAENYVQAWVKINAEFWSGVLKAHTDINIYLENMFDTHPAVLEALSDELCGYENYGVCLDYSHAHLSKMAPEIWAERLGRFVKHVHINDHDGSHDLHLAWGDGVTDRKKFYDCYEKYMKDATVLVETSLLENQRRSLKMMKEEGFLD